MQTYLPYPDFYKSAMALDKKRLNNQRNECLVIAEILMDKYPEEHPWVKHPAVRMWRYHLIDFSRYLLAINAACIRKKIKSNGKAGLRVLSTLSELCESDEESEGASPPWMGGFIHENHRAKLLFKDPEFYSQYNWKEEPDGRSYYTVPWGRKQLTGYGDQKRKEGDRPDPNFPTRGGF